jgi:hypothetical protein
MRHVAHIGEIRNAYKIIMWKHEGKLPLINFSIDGRII